jgi:hypothetical protein
MHLSAVSPHEQRCPPAGLFTHDMDMMGDITDPSDFPLQFAVLRDLDTILRCAVCKEEYDYPPVILTSVRF